MVVAGSVAGVVAQVEGSSNLTDNRTRNEPRKRCSLGSAPAPAHRFLGFQHSRSNSDPPHTTTEKKNVWGVGFLTGLEAKFWRAGAGAEDSSEEQTED